MAKKDPSSDLSLSLSSLSLRESSGSTVVIGDSLLSLPRMRAEHKPSFATTAIHADDCVDDGLDVAPPLHVSSTFKYTDNPQPGDLEYCRVDQPTRARAEIVLGKLAGGELGASLLYASGLAALHAIVTHVKPQRVACRGGYFGCIGAFKQMDLTMIDIDDEFSANDLVWVETPRNATCDVFDIAHYSTRARAAGARLAVDSTFAPPPLQYPLDLGADYVMYSTTKFLAGHSDALGGAVVIRNNQWHDEMRGQRTYLGNCIGTLEAWLLLRSMRTLFLRIERQSKTAEQLANALQSQPGVVKVMHPSLDSQPDHSVAKRQMTGGYGGVFAVELESKELAIGILKKTKYFIPATSLGGVESLIDYRYRWDKTASQSLLRLSVGLESYDDLLFDFTTALAEAAAELKSGAK